MKAPVSVYGKVAYIVKWPSVGLSLWWIGVIQGSDCLKRDMEMICLACRISFVLLGVEANHGVPVSFSTWLNYVFLTSELG